MDETFARAEMPMCERCGKVRATTSLNFSYRGEEYTARYYCAPCCDAMWDLAVEEVNARAAKLKAYGIHTNGAQ